MPANAGTAVIRSSSSEALCLPPLRCVFPCWHSARAFHETDLDLYIYDENGNLIDSDAGNSFPQAFGFQCVEVVKTTKHLDAI